MEKMNCDIIRDLVPSYVDEVCSQATKECVEAHLEECGECRLIAARLRSNALSGEKLEQKGLDGMKKIRQIITVQRAVCFGILLFMVYCGIQMFLAKHANYALFDHRGLLEAACIIVVLVSSLGRRKKQSPGKAAYLCGAFSLALDIYLMLLFLYFTTQIETLPETIFGVKLNQTGPFLEKQLAAAFIAQIAFFLYNLWCIIRQDRNCIWLLCLNIMGIFLTLNYDHGMYLMDSIETLLPAYLYGTLELIIPGILGIIVSLMISRKGTSD